MVAPFTDLRDGDAENLIYLVLSGFITRPTLPASLLISAHIASRAGRLLAITKIASAYPQICVNLFKILLLCSIFFSVLWRTRLNNVADKPPPCLTPLLMKKGLLIFPIHYYFALGSFKCHFHEQFYLFGYPKTR